MFITMSDDSDECIDRSIGLLKHLAFCLTVYMFAIKNAKLINALVTKSGRSCQSWVCSL